MEHPAGAGIEPADTIPAIFAGFSPARIPGAVSRHIRLDPSSLGKLWVNPRELTARDFSLAESSESGGILCVFPAFGTARIGEKSRCSAEGDLFRDSLKEHAAHFGAGKAGRIQTGIHWGVQPLLCHLSYRLMCPRPAFAGRDLPPQLSRFSGISRFQQASQLGCFVHSPLIRSSYPQELGHFTFLFFAPYFSKSGYCATSFCQYVIVLPPF